MNTNHSENQKQAMLMMVARTVNAGQSFQGAMRDKSDEQDVWRTQYFAALSGLGMAAVIYTDDPTAEDRTNLIFAEAFRAEGGFDSASALLDRIVR